MVGDSGEKYWTLRLEKCRQALETNIFRAYVVENPEEAGQFILQKLIVKSAPQSASWGDSMTLHATGVLEPLRENPGIELIETFAADVPREEIIERRRQALLVDLFFTGSNALTE